jgi:zinc/manganese transport system substrate-binding protein
MVRGSWVRRYPVAPRRRPALGAAVAAVAGVLVALLLAGCGGGASGGADGGDLGNGLQGPQSSAGAPAGMTGGRVRVVAGENMWGDVAAQIGGSAVTVTSIIDKPGQDPHEYESALADADAVAHAQLVIENGAGYDDFVGRLLGTSHPTGRVVIDVARLVGVNGSNPNPHLWYQPQYVLTAADEIARRLTAVDPGHAASFAANLRAFRSGEQQVIDVVGQIRARFGGTEVGYTERLPGYLLTAAGLRQGTPAGFAQAVEDGDDPNPIDTARFQDEISSHRMKVLIYNAQVSDSVTDHLKSFAAAHDVAVIGMTETMPPGAASFQDWQSAQARALLAALNG